MTAGSSILMCVYFSQEQHYLLKKLHLRFARANLFNLRRHLASASHYRNQRIGALTNQQHPREMANMLLGVPKEIKTHEYRVGLTTGSVLELVHHGHQVMVQSGAGDGIGLSDDLYRAAGAEVVADRRRGVRAGRDGGEGQGAPTRRVQNAAGGPGAVYLPAPGAGPGPDAGRCWIQAVSPSPTRRLQAPTIPCRCCRP